MSHRKLELVMMKTNYLDAENLFTNCPLQYESERSFQNRILTVFSQNSIQFFNVLFVISNGKYINLQIN